MSCKITTRKSRRRITYDEFVKQKNSPPFDTIRQIGKMSNFLLIFGGSPKMFTQMALETRWSHTQVLDFIKENRLESLRDRLMSTYGKRETPTMVDYITVGTFMKESFFRLYPGLAERIERNRTFAEQNGYIQTLFGLSRKTIVLMLKGEHDAEVNSLLINNLRNIAANTDIQLFEGVVINPAITRITEELMERKMKSSIFNMVHDSIDLYVHKSELRDVIEILERQMTKPLPELKGIKLGIDISVVDLSKGDYYKHGQSPWHYLNNNND